MLQLAMFIGILFVGGCFAFLGMMILWRNLIFEQQSIKIHGRVVDILSEGEGGYTRRYPIIEYQFQAQKRRFKSQYDIKQSVLKINEQVPIYVFQKHLDSAMTVRFIEKIKGVGYLFSAMGIVTCVIGLLVGSEYFKDGVDINLVFNDFSAYGELFFAVMFMIAVLRAISMFSDLFSLALKGSPLENNSTIVIEEDQLHSL